VPNTVRSAFDEVDLVAAANLTGVNLQAARNLPDAAQWLAFAKAAYTLGKRRGRKTATEDLARKLKTFMDDAVENVS
jgi:hypothetical protein